MYNEGMLTLTLIIGHGFRVGDPPPQTNQQTKINAQTDPHSLHLNAT